MPLNADSSYNLNFRQHICDDAHFLLNYKLFHCYRVLSLIICNHEKTVLYYSQENKQTNKRTYISNLYYINFVFFFLSTSVQTVHYSDINVNKRGP